MDRRTTSKESIGVGSECRRECGGLWEPETGLDRAVLTVRREETLGPREANPTRICRREESWEHHGSGGGQTVYSPQGLRCRGVGVVRCLHLPQAPWTRGQE